MNLYQTYKKFKPGTKVNILIGRHENLTYEIEKIIPRPFYDCEIGLTLKGILNCEGKPIMWYPSELKVIE